MSSFDRENFYPGIPNGWFAVSFSKDLVAGEVRRVRYFDEELVLFRGRSGRPYVLSAYCPHLGAHLAEGGRVVGETVRCPFHGWQYDGEGGECVAIPYCKKIPPKARVQPWTVVERNRMIFVWHHAEGIEPDWEVPEISEFSDSSWVEARTFELEVPCHIQDMAENNCDPVHFQYVHKMADTPPSQIEYAADGRYFRSNSQSKRETPYGTFDIDLERDTWGMGLNAVRLKGLPEAGLLMFASTSPVDQSHTHSRWIFTTTSNMADFFGEEFIENLSSGVLDDMRIWENKVHRAQPVLCEADEHLAEFRRWTKQFYSKSD